MTENNSLSFLRALNCAMPITKISIRKERKKSGISDLLGISDKNLRIKLLPTNTSSDVISIFLYKRITRWYGAKQWQVIYNDPFKVRIQESYPGSHYNSSYNKDQYASKLVDIHKDLFCVIIRHIQNISEADLVRDGVYL